MLPIGGKTRVVTFGELEEFPGRETIVMTQTVGDFKSLHNKYRHVYLDKNGEPQSIPLGTYWIEQPGAPPVRRRHGVHAAARRRRRQQAEPVARLRRQADQEAGLRAKFLDFMLNIICSGNEEHFDYLIKREATILQKRIRTEVALGLRTKEEGCGKGFYEKTMGRLLGTHAMQLSNPKHIIGKFNPHLETLLRLTADEALFVGNPEHRNALFGLITEPTLTIEPKGCGVYTAASYLNLSITSNSDHFIPVSDTARRFFIPTVSTARMQDSRVLRRAAGRTRQRRLRGAALPPAARGRSHRLQRPQGAADRSAEAAARPEPAAAGGVVVRAAGDRHAVGSRSNQNRTARSATATSAGSRSSTALRLRRHHHQIRYVTQPGLFDQARESSRASRTPAITGSEAI